MTALGRIVSVYEQVRGADLAIDHSAGATTLQLEDVLDFEEPVEGRTIQVQVSSDTTSEIRTVTALDDDDDTLTISAGLTNSYVAGDRVEVYPETLERMAQVRLDDAEEEGEVADCIIAHALWDRLPPGVREPGTEEAIAIDDSGDEWKVQDVLTQVPIIQAEVFQTGDPEGSEIVILVTGVLKDRIAWMQSGAELAYIRYSNENLVIDGGDEQIFITNQIFVGSQDFFPESTINGGLLVDYGGLRVGGATDADNNFLALRAVLDNATIPNAEPGYVNIFFNSFTGRVNAKDEFGTVRQLNETAF